MVDYRGTVYDWYCRLKKRNQPVFFDEQNALRKQANEVERTFDIVAVMVLGGMVKFDWFYDKYFLMALKVWVACEQDIERQARVNSHAGENFRALIAKIRERTDIVPQIDCSKVDPA
jgi:hypothetical protein